MSTDTPRPERVTLTSEEKDAIHRAGDIHRPDHCDCYAYVFQRGFQEDDCCAGLLDTFDAVERILAAREQALREEIAGVIEAHGARWDHSADWRCGVDEAGDIARGSVR